MIELTPAVKAAIDSGAPKSHLFRLELANITLYLTTAGYNQHWNGMEFVSNGWILGIDSIKKDSEIRVGNRSLVMSGVSQELIAEFEGTNQVNRMITQWEAYCDSNGQIIPDPIMKHTWFITSHAIDTRPPSTDLEIRMASEWANFEASSGRHTTTRSQARFFPGDLAFEHSHNTTKELTWGK